jgi:hypothetical protein
VQGQRGGLTERLRTRRDGRRLKAWSKARSEAYRQGIIGLVSPGRRAVQSLCRGLRRFGGSWFWGWLGIGRSLMLRGAGGIGCHPWENWLFRGWIAGLMGAEAPGELPKHGMLVVKLLL